LVSNILVNKKSNIKLIRMGFNDAYIFNVGGRGYLHKMSKLDEESIIKNIKDMLNKT